MSPKKRTADDLDGGGEPSTVRQPKKLFPIFSEPPSGPERNQDATFRWISPALGPNRTCLHGLNLSPKSSPKVAAFDLDGCIIQSSFPKKGIPPSQFHWWRPSVPGKLKELHDQGYSIIIITNQALRSAALADWRKKVPFIAAALPDVPFRLLAATARDGFRKPMPGMWYELVRIFAQDSVRIDLQESFFVGDAAGRAGDHAGTDRKWALNVNIPFFTPEEYFLKLPTASYTLQGFHVSSIPKDVPLISPTSTPLLPAPSAPEIVLFVGFPALGKSSFYRTHFEPAGYVHVNQDTLRTRDKCVKAALEAVQNGKSCVVDNTNRDAQTRKHFVNLAQKSDVPIRCVVFNGSIELAWHNNLYRAYNLPPSLVEKNPKRDLVPYTAFTSFRAQYEEPQLNEGFTQIRKVNWTFEGDEEQRQRWSMWLQIDGR
ncbi:Bifunctional polynucleotide phosphatase/kinase [Sparassis crispa]|uniref:Bifunctional polynucleotide phosphatase/kinase n=1 Tax=Sparassis crispa TaxID=139825 RepID=A0A401GK83_9APHY|nr:Bifunctional polynucleotide phosphatase/kinase [Sparassis crispa]GBE82578.1 Bifunctional polynucleotide phosphatase/kinase [Sparassis crispa]